jgi:hypothetical protein
MLSLKMARKSYRLSEKLRLIDPMEKENGRNIQLLSVQFNISCMTLFHWWYARNELKSKANLLTIKPTTKHIKFSDYPDVDEALFMYVLNMRSRTPPIPLSRAWALQKATFFARKFGYKIPMDETISEGFLRKWQERRKISLESIHGESASAPVTSVREWKSITFPSILERFNLEDIYNADETGLYYQCFYPRQSLVLHDQKAVGEKQSKARVTILFCVSATGQKLKPLVLGKSRNPRGLPKDKSSLPVLYHQTNNAWMTTPAFYEWIKVFSRHIELSGRRVCLILDNCPSHKLQEFFSPQVELCFYPPNTTSVLQSLDVGIIKVFKQYYKRHLLEEFIESAENEQPFEWTMRKTVELIDTCWKKVSVSTIRNCFAHTGISEELWRRYRTGHTSPTTSIHTPFPPPGISQTNDFSSSETTSDGETGSEPSTRSLLSSSLISFSEKSSTVGGAETLEDIASDESTESEDCTDFFCPECLNQENEIAGDGIHEMEKEKRSKIKTLSLGSRIISNEELVNIVQARVGREFIPSFEEFVNSDMGIPTHGEMDEEEIVGEVKQKLERQQIRAGTSLKAAGNPLKVVPDEKREEDAVDRKNLFRAFGVLKRNGKTGSNWKNEKNCS